MNRRNTLLAVPGAVAAAALLTAGVRPVRAQTAARSLTASQYRQQTLQGGSFTLQSSQLAMRNAQHPAVRQFAQFEINEQLALAQVLTDTASPPLAALDGEHTTALAALQRQATAGFDRAYVQAQILGHQELLRIQQAYLDTPPSSLDLQHIAILARNTVMTHLSVLQALQVAVTA